MASTLLRSESRVVVIAGNCRACARPGRARRPSPHKQKQKPGTGAPLHTKEPVTVASFRTWRGWRENVARNRCLTLHLSKRSPKIRRPPEVRISLKTFFWGQHHAVLIIRY